MKTVEDASQDEKSLRMRVTSLKLALKAERDCTARFEEECFDQIAKDRDVFIQRQNPHDVLKDQLKGMEKISRHARGELMVAASELKKWRL